MIFNILYQFLIQTRLFASLNEIENHVKLSTSPCFIFQILRQILIKQRICVVYCSLNLVKYIKILVFFTSQL